MAAYGALVSLMHIIDTLEKHPHPPISIHKTQLQSLTQNVTFFQNFLDGRISHVVECHDEADPLERRIADAVYAAEDVIESQIVLQIEPRSKNIMRFRQHGWPTNSEEFYHKLEQVIEEMNLIKNEVTETATVAQLQEAMETLVVAPLQQKHVAASMSSSTVKDMDTMMVGFDQVFDEVLDKLAGNQRKREIIPIVGMGGIGKTTLAKKLFVNALVKEDFHVRARTTISQTYNVREILRDILLQASGESSDSSENEVGHKLYKYLSGRRYLVIMDDMWSIEAWNRIKFFFPDYQNRSRIIVTTRLSNLGCQLNESYRVDMKFLDEDNSWGLFCKTVFGEEKCPLDLEDIGRNIVANCKGLPLTIATIGGLLAKSECTREYWKCIEQNLKSIVINSNDGFCLKILMMSYIYLPNYLKPCFLYMGVFEEDRRIRVSMLEKLWVSEGFLKPRSGKCLETIAKECFKELVDRNLILVDELGLSGNVKYCKIHDLLRDLCLKEVEKERFHHVIRDAPLTINTERRVVFPVKSESLLTSEVLGSLSHARSILLFGLHLYQILPQAQMPPNLTLLRIFKAYDDGTRSGGTRSGGTYLHNVFRLVNSRYLAVRVHIPPKFPSSIDKLWNLQTLIIHPPEDLYAPTEIWKLHQLRYLECHELILPYPTSRDNGIVIMENLHTLKGVLNLFLNEEVVRRIPNVKKLHLKYNVGERKEENCLSHLECLSKLENFHCSTKFPFDIFWQRIKFPHSLKKLSVDGFTDLELEVLMPKIGSLPLLEKLVLKKGRFDSGKWETTEGQFPNLKFLILDCINTLEDWIVSDNSHFPLLQKLHLRHLSKLKEIPLEIGEIATLRSISVVHCSRSAVVSAKRIVDEQEDLHGDQLDLHVRVEIYSRQKELKRLASANFEFC